MINDIIKKSLQNIFLTIISFVIIVLGWVYVIFFKTPVDALPDLSENQVVVMTMWPGQSPTNIENQITYPVTVWLQWLAWVRDIRAMSQLGLSMVTVIFEDSVDEYFARNRILERLPIISSDLPPGVTPILWPDATGLGQIFMYTLESDKHSLTQLRTLQDFYVKLWLQSISGVAEVASIWWYKQTYQVNIDTVKLKSYNLNLSQVLNTVRMSNRDVSGRTIDIQNSEIAIQWYGFYEWIDDIKKLVIWYRPDKTAIKIEDIAEVIVWSAFRRWILADEFWEKVGWIVVMRYWENPLDVTRKIKEKITQIETSLPEGVSVDIFYDRTSLITEAIETLKNILTQEIIIVWIVLFLFLMNFWASIITVIALIVGVIMTFIMMYFMQIPSNIMSLGWIAIAIGTMVDSAIVVTENIYKRLIGKENISFQERFKIVQDATLEVWRPLVFAIFIIILSFAPIFALQGMEGKLFIPLAFTNMFAMFGALVASLFLVPILCLFFMKWKLRRDEELFIVKITTRIYKPILDFALKFRKTVIGITIIIFLVSLGMFLKIWNEFMPPLDEWSIMYMPVTLPDVSEKRALEILIETNKIISNIPEVEKVVGKAGRALTATDPAPLSMIETIITLKPRKEWRKGVMKQDIINEMNANIKISNLWNGFTQPIIWRIDMLSTGIRTQVWIKIFGDNPNKLEELAIRTAELMNELPGWMWVTAIRNSWLKYLEIDIDDSKLSLYGVKKTDVLDAISVWFGWNIATTTINGRERFDVEVRLKNIYRDDLDKIKSLQINSPTSQILLSSVAEIRFIEWPAVITTENGLIRWAVQMNVAGMWLVEYVQMWKGYLNENLELPEWYFIEWSGQYENQQRAKKTLTLVVPVVILIIFILLFVTYQDFWLVSIVALSIPFSLIGWFVALYISWFNISVAVWVWFISLFWNAVETWVVMMLYLENAFKERFGLDIVWHEEEDILIKEKLPITKEGIREAIEMWALTRLRPILMTAFTSVIWLIPMLTSTWVWAELQKPLAIVVVGWLVTSIFLTLVLLPVLFSYLRE